MAFGTGLRLKSDVAEGVALDHRRSSRSAAAAASRVVTAGAPRAATLPPRSRPRRVRGRARALLGAGVAPDGRPAELPLPRRARARRAASRARAGSSSSSPTSATTAGRRRCARSPSATPCTAIEIADPREAELPDVGHLVAGRPGDRRARSRPTPRSPRVRAAFAAAEAERRAQVAEAIRRAARPPRDAVHRRRLAARARAGAAMTLRRPASTCSRCCAIPARRRRSTRSPQPPAAPLRPALPGGRGARGVIAGEPRWRRRLPPALLAAAAAPLRGRARQAAGAPSPCPSRRRP